MRVLMGRARLRAERLAEAERDTHPACNAHFVLLLGGKGIGEVGRRVCSRSPGSLRKG